MNIILFMQSFSGSAVAVIAYFPHLLVGPQHRTLSLCSYVCDVTGYARLIVIIDLAHNLTKGCVLVEQLRDETNKNPTTDARISSKLSSLERPSVG